MNVRSFASGLLVALAASGCPSRHEPVDAPSHVARQPVANPLPPDPPAPPPAPDAEDQRRTNDALAVAADAAEQAARGTDDCESAHNQLVAMLETVERELSEPVYKPVRADFVEVCREMPAEARRCIVPTYAMEHQDACTTALEALPEDVTQRFQAIVNGPGSD